MPDGAACRSPRSAASRRRSRAPPTIPRASRSASCTSASAPSTARTRRSTPTTSWRRDPRWGICGVSLKTPRAIEPLAAQDGLYTLLTRTSEGVAPRVIGALRETMFAGDARDRAGRALRRSARSRSSPRRSPRRAIATIRRPARSTRRIRTSSHDLAHPDAPESAIGLLVAGLAARRAANAGPLTFVCCDNLPHNGRMVEGLVHAFAQRRDAGARRTGSPTTSTFPSTMVDRIVPATTDADIADARAPARRARRRAGRRRAVRPVGHRGPLRGRAPAVGGRRRAVRRRRRAVRVDEAAPAERQPLDARVPRLPGRPRVRLAGVVAIRCSRRSSSGRWPRRSCRRSCSRPASISRAYCGDLLTRFRNPALPHRTRQIAMDGSQKLPQRLLGTVRDRLAAGAPLAHLPLAVAGWIRYASGTRRAGRRHRGAGSAGARPSRRSWRRRSGDSGRHRRRLPRSRERVRRDLVRALRVSAPRCARTSVALFRDGAR